MKHFFLAILAISLATGCTTTRTYHSIDSASAGQVEPGSAAVIERIDGSREEVEILKYGASSLEVIASDETRRSIDYADIRAVHARQLDGRKTAGLVAVALLAVGLTNALGDFAVFPSGTPAL